MTVTSYTSFSVMGMKSRSSLDQIMCVCVYVYMCVDMCVVCVCVLLSIYFNLTQRSVMLIECVSP